MTDSFPPAGRDVAKAVATYLDHGWSVIPVRPEGKRPLVRWEDYQRRRPELAEWDGWLRMPGVNVALVTGAISGVTVVDVDGPEGVAAMRTLGRELPRTMLQQSPHGWHLFFRYESGVRNKTGLLPGVDVRGDGCYVLVSPSRLTDGEYTWKRAADLMAFPPWLKEGGLTAGSRGGASGQPPRWVARCLVEGAPLRERNSTATRLAGYFFGRGLPEDVVLAALEPFRNACRPEMDPDELVRTVRSVARYRRFAVAMGVGDPPTVQRTAAGERYLWDEVAAEVRGVTRNKTALLGEISFTLALPGMAESVRAPTVLNLLSQRERDSLAQSLQRQVPEVAWGSRIDVLCLMAIESHRRGEPAVLLREAQRPPSGDAYALKPLILADAPTVWFADGGTGKSLLALAAACAMAGHDVLGGLRASAPRRVLYLDWEWDDWQHAQRLRQLLGDDIDVADILYRRCNGALGDEIESIRQIVADEEARFVIVDSLGAACGGDLIDAQTALDFSRLIRSLGVGSLWITHTTKSGSGDEKPFGTVYFHNSARLSWRLKREMDARTDSFAVGFYNHKSNATALHKPLGFRISFEGERTTIVRTDILASAELTQGLPLKERILAALSRAPLSAADLAEEVGTTKNAAQVKLNALQRAGRAMKLGDGRWAVAQGEVASPETRDRCSARRTPPA